MGSILVITKVEAIQRKIAEAIRGNNRDFGIYVSLNKNAKKAIEELGKTNASVEKIFMIDCVSSEKMDENILQINPRELGKLSFAIREFLHEIPGEKWLILDSLSTLLIYNNDNKVAQFMKEITEYSSEKGVHVMAFTPKTGEEELLNKIYGFFDKVEGK
ncbi:hypothetical protein HY989_00620 [Candidatus Micrarchaeota archaeon]|nr:hypothetical protein [Candidatus Micrarchaeota archaeon]